MMNATNSKYALDMEYVNPYDGYHHERLTYRVTDPIKKNFNPTTIKAQLLSKIEISSEEPALFCRGLSILLIFFKEPAFDSIDHLY